MRIGGLLKTSLIDYPGKISAVVFMQGCNFRCIYCHNTDLVYPEKFGSTIPEEDVLEFLKKRKGLLEGVVITGGEPLIQPGIDIFTGKVASLGFPVKIDTNGSFPGTLEKLIKSRIIDYIAMDIKAPPENYKDITGTAVDFNKIVKSVNIIKNSGVDYEFRTTYVNSICTPHAAAEIEKIIRGAKRYYIQKSNYRDSCNITPDKTEMMIRIFKKSIKNCNLR